MKNLFKNKQAIILLCYSFIAKFFHSLASPLFPHNAFQPDVDTFYTIGRALLEGKVLYRDIIDNKYPYAYFIYSIAYLFKQNHIGIYLMEVIALLFTLYFIYKIILLYVEDKPVALLGAFIVSLMLNCSSLILSVSKLECYELPFIVASLYIGISYVKEKDESFHPLALGILTGAVTMINLKAAFNIFPIYLMIFIYDISKKSILKFFKGVFWSIPGVVIALIPYIIYVIITNSYDSVFYGFVTLPLNYVAKNASLHYNPDTIFGSIYMYVKSFPLFFIILFATLVITIIYEKNIYVKIMYVLSIIITTVYTAKANNPFVYYLVIFIPYFTPLYIFIFNIYKKIFLKKRKVIPAICYLFISICIIANFPIGYFQVKNTYLATDYMQRCIKKAVEENDIDLNSSKVLSIGYAPQVYTALDIVPAFPYFVVMFNTYEATKEFVDAQYGYIKNKEADVVIVNLNNTSFLSFPMSMRVSISNILSSDYELVAEVDTSTNSGIYQVYRLKA